MKDPFEPKKPESPMLFLIVLWLLGIGFVVLVWYALLVFLAAHH